MAEQKQRIQLVNEEKAHALWLKTYEAEEALEAIDGWCATMRMETSRYRILNGVMGKISGFLRKTSHNNHHIEKDSVLTKAKQDEALRNTSLFTSHIKKESNERNEQRGSN